MKSEFIGQRIEGECRADVSVLRRITQVYEFKHCVELVLRAEVFLRSLRTVVLYVGKTPNPQDVIV